MPITFIILAITCVVSFIAFNNRKVMDDLILWPPAISRHKEYHRLVTYGLVHADIGHLLFNMLTLFFFGRYMEGFYAGQLGAFGFALFYIGGLVVSILPTYLRNRGNPNYRSLGASGAVSAVLFGFVVLAPWQPIIVFVVPMPAIIYAVLYTAIRSTWTGVGRATSTTAHTCGARPTACCSPASCSRR